VENTTALASARKDAEGLTRKVSLLVGELAETRRAWEVFEEKFCSLSKASGDVAGWLVVFEMERWKQIEELSLL
jgi:NTP pyrophosphatase (non-canonical NTP hydrolase)